MVRRRIAERADDDRRPRAGRSATPDALGAGQAEGKPHRLGQVAGDRAGLRRDPQRAGCPIPCGGPGRWGPRWRRRRRAACRSTGVLPGSWRERAMKNAARAVVEERRVVDAQARAEDRVVLVAGRADGVEAAGRLLQLAGGDVDLRARRAGPRTSPAPRPRSASVPARSGAWGAAGWARPRRSRDRCRAVLDDGDAIPGHSMGPAGWLSGRGPANHSAAGPGGSAAPESREVATTGRRGRTALSQLSHDGRDRRRERRSADEEHGGVLVRAGRRRPRPRAAARPDGTPPTLTSGLPAAYRLIRPGR